MGDWLRLCPPAGPGTKPSAHFKKLERNGARLVPDEATCQQKVDAVLAIPAWCNQFPAAGLSSGASHCAAIQSVRETDSPGPFVSAVAGREIGAKQSTACIAAVQRTAANPGEARPAPSGITNTVRIRRGSDFAESRFPDPGIHADLRSRPLRRRALRHDSPAPIARSDSLHSARALNFAVPLCFSWPCYNSELRERANTLPMTKVGF